MFKVTFVDAGHILGSSSAEIFLSEGPSAKKVNIFGEEISVLAAIRNFTGLSAHADRDGLLKWINCFDKKPEKIFITHGEDSACVEFVKSLNGLGFAAVAPIYKASYDLSNGKLISSGIKIEKVKIEGDNMMVEI